MKHRLSNFSPFMNKTSLPILAACFSPILIALIPILLFWPNKEQIFVPTSTYWVALSRSCLLFFCTTIFGLIIAFFLIMKKIEIIAPPSTMDYLSLTPLIVGEISIGFILKYLSAIEYPNTLSFLTNSALSHSIFIILFFGILLAQLIYVLGAQMIFNSNVNILEYARQHKITPVECTANFFLSEVSTIITLGIIFSIIFIAYESGISHIGFSASPGGSQEMWPNALSVIYRKQSSIDLQSALFLYSALAVASFVVFVGILFILRYTLINGNFKKLGGLNISKETVTLAANLFGVITKAPFFLMVTLILFIGLNEVGSLNTIPELPPLIFSVFCSMLASFISVFLAYFLIVRMHIYTTPTKIRTVTISVFIASLIALLVPKIALAQGILGLSLLLHLNNDLSRSIGWFCAHIITTLPLCFMFALGSINRNNNSSWLYIRSSKISTSEYFKNFLLKERGLEILILISFVSCFIWVDYSISNIFSHQIGSVSKIVLQSVEGRASSISIAAFALLIACLGIATSLAILGKAVNKYE